MVDEDSNDAAFVKSLLEFLPGFKLQFVHAATLKKGTDLLFAGGFDLVFFDIRMEPGNGLEMLQAIRGRGIRTPVIILTGMGDEKLAVDLMKAGADDYLVKQDLTVPILEKSIRFTLRQHQLEREKELLRVELIHAQKMEALGTLAGGLAHDFNNLLTGITGYSRIGLLKSRDAPARKNFDSILTIGNKMAQLVDKILRFAQPVKLGTEFVDFSLVIDDVISILKHTIPKNIKISARTDKSECLIIANSAEIEQILLNLCVNAVEAMPQGGTLTVRAGKPSPNNSFFRKNPELNPDSCCLLEVTDTGSGIPKEYSDRIFDPFFSTKDTPDRRGTGLGLSIVYNTVTSYGGHISFKNRERGGTIFQVLFPGPNKKCSIERTDNGTQTPRGSESVLIVDDEKHVREVVKESLEWLGYKVFLAGNGRDAIRFIESTDDTVQLILLDILMPEMGGEECLAEIVKIAPEIPVVIFSGHSNKELASELMDAGAVAFLSKPVGIGELGRTVRQTLDSNIADFSKVTNSSPRAY